MSIKESNIIFKSEGRDINGFLTSPDQEGQYPGIIVIHEAFGINDNIKDISRKFASEGYAALAVDLFSGENQFICIAKTMQMLVMQGASTEGIQYLRSGIDYLSAQPFVNSDKIGAIGFCMGGNFAISLSYHDRRVKTIAPFYGVLPRGVKNFSQICPTVASYPDMDITTNSAKKLKVELDKSGVENDVKIYPKTLHSFMNDRIPLTYNQESAKDAWDRTLSFFCKHLNK